jgi:hypothetical protein
MLLMLDKTTYFYQMLSNKYVMKNINFKKPAFYKIAASVIIATAFVSCGSYQSVSYNDGIYSDNQESYQAEEIQPQDTYSDNSSAYYESLFQQGAESHGNNFAADSVFTDVESYSNSSYDASDPDYTASYGGGEAGWGTNPSQVIVNYYDNGFGWNNGFYGNGFYGNGFGWNNWGWNRGFGWNNGFYGNGFGWNSWAWNAGFGWNNGFYGNGFGWNNWGWNGNYGNQFGGNYGRNNINGYAYQNTGRTSRGQALNYNTRGRSVDNGRSSYYGRTDGANGRSSATTRSLGRNTRATN